MKIIEIEHRSLHNASRNRKIETLAHSTNKKYFGQFYFYVTKTISRNLLVYQISTKKLYFFL